MITQCIELRVNKCPPTLPRCGLHRPSDADDVGLETLGKGKAEISAEAGVTPTVSLQGAGRCGALACEWAPGGRISHAVGYLLRVGADPDAGANCSGRCTLGHHGVEYVYR